METPITIKTEKNGDNGPRRRESQERSPTDRSPPGRDNRRIGIGHGGFMSPMRRVAEAAHRTPKAHYTDNVDAPREPQEIIDTHHVDEERDSTPRQFVQTERNIPTTNEQWEDNNREPEIIVEGIPLLNGVPPTSQSET